MLGELRNRGRTYPPHQGELQSRSHAAEAAPTKHIPSNTSCPVKRFGETISEERRESGGRNGAPCSIYFEFGSECKVA